MLRITLSKILIPVLFLFFLFPTSCRKDSDEYYDFSTVYPLPDSIPYNTLGEGTLVFCRNNNTMANRSYAAYVVDINQHISWFCEGLYAPSVSPDGRHLVFDLFNTKNNPSFDVYISDNDGKNCKRLTDTGGYSPCWTPEGRQILYFSDYQISGMTYKRLYRQSPVPDPADRTLVVDFGGTGVSPQGKVSLSSKGKYAISSNGIYTFDSAGNNFHKIIPVLSDSDYYYSPVWSPDGSRLALSSLRIARNYSVKSFAVLLFNPDGSNPDTLVKVSPISSEDVWWSNNYTLSLCWSPDGKQIAFNLPVRYYFDTDANIYVIGTDHKGLTQVTKNPFAFDYNLSWSH